MPLRASSLIAISLLACDGHGGGTGATELRPISPAPLFARTPVVDTQDLARRLVTRSARIRQGDLVLLTGRASDLPLLEELAIESRRTGADPLVTVRSDGYRRREYDEVPARQDSRPSEMARRLAGLVTAEIVIESDPADTLLPGVSPGRIAARLAAMTPARALADHRGVRRVFLGNGLYPTEDRARRFGMGRAALAELFWRGLDVDYDALQATGADIRRRLAHGRTVQLTDPNGTDLTLDIAGRPALVSDGIISPEDERQGGAATTVRLPAGEVLLTPVPGTARGVVIVAHYLWGGGAIEELRLEFARGRLVSLRARSDLAPLRAFYDAAPAGKDELGVLDIGINPNLAIPDGTRLVGRMPAGMVSLVVGANDWAGGDNHAVSGIAPVLPGATVLVDGVPLVYDGRLVPAAPALTDRP
jgi:aminopeptidase